MWPVSTEAKRVAKSREWTVEGAFYPDVEMNRVASLIRWLGKGAVLIQKRKSGVEPTLGFWP